MADIVVSALLTVVFEKLTSAVLTKFGRSKKVHSDLEEWNKSLKQIRRLLNDASDKEIKNKRVKDWLNRLHHLAYDIDDILDSLATDHAMHPELTQESETTMVTKVRKLDPLSSIASTVKRLFPSFMSSTSNNDSDTEMHGKLNDITTKLQQLYAEKDNLGLTVKDGRSKDKNKSHQTSLFDPTSIVGREAEKQVLLQKLLADHEPRMNQRNFSIVPIVGMGGIGKTTLARLLYDDKQVKEHFDIKAWVCVSDEESDSFDSFYISKLIFDSVATERKTFENPDKLQEALKDQLNGKRFLLVLDDLWSEKIQDWEILAGPFHAVAPRSKIVVTTRKENLLQQLGCNNPYHLNKLSDNDALSLFAHYALGANNFDAHQTLRPYGEDIVKKCDGLPLALKALGSLLRRTQTYEEKWKEVLESKIWKLKDEGGILPALRLSYQELPACLKQLFAYTCLFPKDCMFEKEDLILLWMAEGFLHETREKSMENLGEECFNELLSRSFFQHLPNDESLFIMHDLMNDLATSVAGEFFVRLDIEMKKDIMKERYRHMSFVREDFLTSKKFETFERPDSLRSFLAVPFVIVMRNSKLEKFYLSNKVLGDLLHRLPLLRVLSLSKLEINEVPTSVGDLKHLRYFNLSETQITHLPENVCDLHNLQTLIVFGCQNLSKLPVSFIKLKNLRHLDIRDTPLLKNMPLGIGDMKSLQTLSKIVIGGVNEVAISRFKNLKNLRRRVSIHGLDQLQNSVQAREAKLFQMKLSELKVEWSDDFDGSRKKMIEREVLDMLRPHSDNLQKLEILSYGGTEFSEWVVDRSFGRLTGVHLYECRNCVFLPPLGQLPSLKKLTIRSLDEVKKVGRELLGTGPAAFPSLENLEFENMKGWEAWSIDITGYVDGVFPCLKVLTIADCPNMAGWEVLSANADVAVFPCLEELCVRRCPKLVKASLEALPSLRVLKVENCGDVLLTSLVGVAFSSMTELWIESISGLSDEVWGGVVKYLGALEELRIIDCNEIRYMWESEEACEVLVNLNRLFITRCENLERFGGEEKEEEEEGNKLFLTSLRMLDIWGCNNMKHLTCPKNIEKLKIEDCENLKHLTCPNSIEELKISSCRSITSVSFPTIDRGGGWQKLKSLDIWDCNNQVLEEELERQVLRINNNTNMSIPTPMLQFLEISRWNNLKSIMELNCFIHLTILIIRDCSNIESFPELQNLALLKHLTIAYCSSMDAPPPPSSDGDDGGRVWPPNLHSLEIGGLKKPISKWGPQYFPTSLVKLRLNGGGTWAEDDVSGGSQLSHILPSSLTTLYLWEFKKMERISEGLQHLTSLQRLVIINCPNLKDVPLETQLPSLLSLVIYDCPEDLKEKTSRSGSYWPRISHIPCVDID